MFGAKGSPDPEPVEIQELTKSCHEALLLAALGRGARHGYQLGLDIEARSAGAFRFRHGTLYPILHKLESDGLIEGTWSPGDAGRKRRSYRLTDAGRAALPARLAAWRAFVDRFFRTVEETS